MNLRIRSLYQKLAPRRTHILLVAILVVALMPVAAHAGFTDWVMLATGKSVEWLVGLVGKLLIAAIDILGKVASYNSFGESEAVNIGWVVIRDIANMLFIVSLIVMSFATIVGWQAYRYSRLLGNLVLATVLVNFSKSIVLFLVDFSQVIMMTFVNALKPVLAGNLITGFGIRSALAFANSTTSVDINLTETVSVYALALILMIIALVVTLSLIIILVNRIIRLWVLIILAPFAFISNVMPGGLGSFNGDWWKKLGTELFVGPVLAFFLWLSLSIIFIASQSGTLGTPDIIKVDALTNQLVVGSNASETQIQAVASEIGSSKNLFNFIATIVLLMHSMTIAKTAAGFGGAAAGKLSGFINSGARSIAGGGLKGLRKAPGALFKGSGAQGMAQRAGYPLAASALTPFKRLPFVGGKIRKAQARIREKQDAVKAEDMNYLRTIPNDELAKIANKFKLTQGGVNESRYAVRELMRRGKEEYITDQGMARYQKAIGYNSTIDYKKGEDGKFALGPDGKKIPIGITENARDREGFELMKKSALRYPLLYKTAFPNAGKGSMEEKAYKAEWVDDLSKMGKSDLLQVKRDTFEKAGDDLSWEKAYADEVANRIKKSPKFHDDYARDAQDFLYDKFKKYYTYNPDTKKITSNAPLHDAPSEKRDRFEEEQELRKRLNIDQAGGANELYEGLNNVVQGNRQNVPANVLSAIDNRILAGTSPEEYLKEVDEYSKGVSSGKYMSDAEFSQAKLQFEQLAKSQAAQEKEVLDLVGGKSAVQRIENEIAKAQESGRAPVARLAANFEKLGLDPNTAGSSMKVVEDDAAISKIEEMYRNQLATQGFAGTPEEMDAAVKDFTEQVKEDYEGKMQPQIQEMYRDHLISKGYTGSETNLNNAVEEFGESAKKARYNEAIPKLEEMYRDQLREEGGAGMTPEMIGEATKAFSDAIKQAQYLAIANTTRKGYSLGHVMRHEGAHPEIEKLSDADREEIFGSLSQDQQNTAITDISKRWGLDALPDAEKRKKAIEEYFTEGLANFGRRDAIGSELDSSMVLAMKAKGVNLRSHQEQLVTSPHARAERDASAQQVREQETVVQNTEQKVNSQIENFKSTHPDSPSFSVDDLQNRLIAKDLQESGASSQELIDLHAAADALKEEKRRLAEFRETMRDAMQKRSGELFNKYRQAQEGLLKKWGEIDKKDYMGDAQQRKMAWTGVYESLGAGEAKMQKLVQQRIADWEQKDGKKFIDAELKERIGEAMEQIVNEELL